MSAITTVTMIGFRGRTIPTVKDDAGAGCLDRVQSQGFGGCAVKVLFGYLDPKKLPFAQRHVALALLP